MTTIKLFGGDLGNETMLVRCNLSEASSPIQVDYCEGSGWDSTQYQCADARHRKGELADIGKVLAARAVEMSFDEFDCEWEQVSQYRDIVAALERLGGRYTGNNVEEAADEWGDDGFTAADVEAWGRVRCWDATTAAAWRDAGLTPAQVETAAELLIEDLEDPSDEYTDGCPIYATCNGDIDRDVIIEAAKALAN